MALSLTSSGGRFGSFFGPPGGPESRAGPFWLREPALFGVRNMAPASILFMAGFVIIIINGRSLAGALVASKAE